VVGGFAILQANSKEEAIELARQFLAVAGEGECEIRQLAEPGDVCFEATSPAGAHAERASAPAPLNS
jgi:hypothetical protein